MSEKDTFAQQLHEKLLVLLKKKCLEEYEEVVSRMTKESRIKLTSMVLTNIVKDCTLNVIFCGERNVDKIWKKIGAPLMEINDCLEGSLGHEHGIDCDCRKKFEETFRKWVKGCIKANEEAIIEEREKN